MGLGQGRKAAAPKTEPARKPGRKKAPAVAKAS
jgi:hypothetical protein